MTIFHFSKKILNRLKIFNKMNNKYLKDNPKKLNKLNQAQIKFDSNSTRIINRILMETSVNTNILNKWSHHLSAAQGFKISTKPVNLINSKEKFSAAL